ncbi:hypothetical protein E4U21_004713 [Claviceps maximensis]|nr:hypothetical protein E4U21_004713 [Claviceps maximensis]
MHKGYLLIAALVWWPTLAAAWWRPIWPFSRRPPNPSLPEAAGKMLTPEFKKAGSAGGLAVPFWRDYIGWFHDGTEHPAGNDGSTGRVGPLAIPTVKARKLGRKKHPPKKFVPIKYRGRHRVDDADMWIPKGPLPQFVLGHRRPELAGIAPKEALRLWEVQMAPLGRLGSMLASPSVLATDRDWWLAKFRRPPLSWDWQITAIHIYEPDLEGVKRRIFHYSYWYHKMIWVTEFGCRHDTSRSLQFHVSPCDDQEYVNRFIADVVEYFEADERVAAYAYPDRNEYCELCVPIDQNATALTPSGEAYLRAIIQYG